MSGALTTTEATRLAECETRIERGLTTFIEVGQALMEIRDDRLYRASHARFEDYCSERWGFRRAQAYRLIDAAATVSPIGDTGLPLPSSESVARELPREPEQAREVWAEAVERHGDKPTAADVREVRTQRDTAGEETTARGPSPAAVVQAIPPSQDGALTPEERVARLPHMVAGKAIERLQDVIKTIEVAGGVDSIMESLDKSPLAPTMRDSWAYFIAEAHDVLGEWRARVENQPELRRIK